MSSVTEELYDLELEDSDSSNWDGESDSYAESDSTTESEKSNNKTTPPAFPFDGIWHHPNGTTKLRVQGDEIYWNPHTASKLIINDLSIRVEVLGSICQGEYKQASSTEAQIVWTDGDIWTKYMELPTSETSKDDEASSRKPSVDAAAEPSVSYDSLDGHDGSQLYWSSDSHSPESSPESHVSSECNNEANGLEMPFDLSVDGLDSVETSVENESTTSKLELFSSYVNLYDFTEPRTLQTKMVELIQLCCIHVDIECESDCLIRKYAVLEHILDVMKDRKAWFCDEAIAAIFALMETNVYEDNVCPEAIVGDDDEWRGSKIELEAQAKGLCYDICYEMLNSGLCGKTIMLVHFSNGVQLSHLINLFQSTRDAVYHIHLYNIIYVIYSKCAPLRSLIRSLMSEKILIFTQENHKSNVTFPGLSNMLEIFLAVVMGYKVPVKEKNKHLIRNILFPLHKLEFRHFESIAPQIRQIMVEIVTKEPRMTGEMFDVLYQFWPKQSSVKEILFLTQINCILEVLELNRTDPKLNACQWQRLFTKISACIGSTNSQVIHHACKIILERENLNNIMVTYAEPILPLLYRNLKKCEEHWNENIATYCRNILEYFKTKMNRKLFTTIALQCDQREKVKVVEKEKSLDRWALLAKSYQGAEI